MSTSTSDPYRHQRRSALDMANEIRLSRAELKHRIARGETPVSEVIAEPPGEAKTWPVGGVLGAQRRWGPDRTRRFLSRLMIRETKPLGALTQAQRARIVEALEDREGGRG